MKRTLRKYYTSNEEIKKEMEETNNAVTKSVYRTILENRKERDEKDKDNVEED